MPYYMHLTACCTSATLRMAAVYSVIIGDNGASAEPFSGFYEGCNFNSGNYLFTTDTK